MKITILAIGSQGDVRPFSALGGGLARAGHSVRFATHDHFRALVESLGLEYAPVKLNPLQIVQGETGQAWLASLDRPLKFMSSISRLAGEVLDSVNDDAWQACKGSDAIVYSLPLSVSGHTMAEVLGVPGIPAALYPLHATWAFPSIMTPQLPIKGRAMNALSAHLVIQAFWQVFRSHQSRWLRTRQGRGGLPLGAPLADFRRRGVPLLYGYSPTVIPRPPDWHDTYKVCGYWFPPERKDWIPPSALQEFLSRGPAPLYVGFGSMASADPARMTQIVLEALEATGQRAILASGWGGLHLSGRADSVLQVESVPHEWLFPQVAAAVHHGGAGTTAAALRAGVPSVVVSFFADQFFWGNRLHEIGAGARALSQKSLTADGLAEAIRSVTSTADARSRCRELASRISREDGVAAGVAAIEDYLGATSRRKTQ